MFELSVALKYLTPRWRQLSVSIISLISILVISLVVWLIVVFFSVTNGLEKGWIQKLTALTAPVRVTPTQAYYDSYYYQVDGISANSDYTLKSLSEKLQASETDPYDPNMDEEAPSSWLQPDQNANGELKDLVKLTDGVIQGIHGVSARDYEVTMSNVRLRLLRHLNDNQQTQAFLNQAAYLGSMDTDNPGLSKTLLSLSPADIENALFMISQGPNLTQEDSSNNFAKIDEKAFHDTLKTFFNLVNIQEMKSTRTAWQMPIDLLKQAKNLQAMVISENDVIKRVYISANDNPHELEGIKQSMEARGFKTSLIQLPNQLDEVLRTRPAITVMGHPTFQISSVVEQTIPTAKHLSDLKFNARFVLQDNTFEGQIPYRALTITQAEAHDDNGTMWLSNRSKKFQLPVDTQGGEAVLVPKAFRDVGILLGDRGYLSYYTPTASAVQEQRLPVYVAGFYDPGIIPIGGKFLLASAQTTSLIRSSHNQNEGTTNGFNVRFDNIDRADEVKASIQAGLRKAGIDRYWHVETYREYDFTRDLLQQLQSDKTLFMLISTVIIIVACSNIISMLIILVNNKKLEIGILRSMGASSLSIATIFGFCGVVMGVMGSIIGTTVAVLTLENIDVLVNLLSKIQGHNAFNPMFYGETLPNEVSFEALLFVILVTGAISLLAGIVPATKASLMKPSSILRAE